VKKACPLDLNDIPEVPKPTRKDMRAQKRQKMLETQRNEKIAEEEADKLRLQDLKSTMKQLTDHPVDGKCKDPSHSLFSTFIYYYLQNPF
jgi:hypothetical protein